MILYHYLRRNIISHSSSVYFILMLIIITNNAARILARTASGIYPIDALFLLVFLMSFETLVLLIPIAFFLGSIWAFGRLQQHNELIIYCIAGIKPVYYYRPVFQIALPLAFITLLLTTLVSPFIYQQYENYRQQALEKAAFERFLEQGQFRNLEKAIFYAESVDKETKELQDIFIEYNDKNQPLIVESAQSAQFIRDNQNNIALYVDKGFWYQGNPGDEDYLVLEFQKQVIPIPLDNQRKKQRLESIPSWQLILSNNPEYKAEWHWRLATPISIILLAIVILPLIQIHRRKIWSLNLVIGILVYMLYMNGLGIARLWLEKGYINFGFWWVHGILLLWALIFFWHKNRLSLKN